MNMANNPLEILQMNFTYRLKIEKKDSNKEDK